MKYKNRKVTPHFRKTFNELLLQIMISFSALIKTNLTY